jgi:hypothetical protein
LLGINVAFVTRTFDLAQLVDGLHLDLLHFEVFASAEAAVSGEAAILTSQFALPEAACRAAYAADPVYRASVAALDDVSFGRDMVFRNGTEAQKAAQMLRVSGDAATGFVGQAEVGLAL